MGCISSEPGRSQNMLLLVKIYIRIEDSLKQFILPIEALNSLLFAYTLGKVPFGSIRIMLFISKSSLLIDSRESRGRRFEVLATMFTASAATPDTLWTTEVQSPTSSVLMPYLKTMRGYEILNTQFLGLESA